MTAFLVRTELSRGQLRLLLSNTNGYAQDAVSVKWTVYFHDGTQVSGKSLPAIRQTCGEYYAPWFTDVKNGNYKVVWEILEDWSLSVVQKVEYVFVVDPSSYLPCGPINREAIPVPGQFTFLSGQALGPGDLTLYLKNSSGFSQNAFSVIWQIFDIAGNCITPRTSAMSSGTGAYYAPWYVSVCSGDYIIKWEWQADSTSPLEARKMSFSVITPAYPFAIVEPVICGRPWIGECLIGSPLILAKVLIGECCEPRRERCVITPGGSPCPATVAPTVPVFPTNQCCDFEIARAVHLLTSPLPPAGNYTNQGPYIIPPSIRNVAFYITYKRGAPGGFVNLRLKWGNGTEETNETLIDTNIQVNEPGSRQNMYLQTLSGPTPPDDNPITFILETSVPGGSTTVRLIAAEGGVPGSPGTCGITLTASTD